MKQDNKNKLASYLQAGRTVGPSTALRKINIGFFLNIDVSAESRSRMDWKSPEPAKKRTGSAALFKSCCRCTLNLFSSFGISNILILSVSPQSL